MLAGFHEMDEHFRTAPLRTRTCRCSWACWRSGTGQFFGAQTIGVMPYDQYLKRFPAYLQQLTMESNGKHVTLDGAHGRLPDRRGLLGRARHQRPAQLLPAHPPGHEADPGRPHRLRQVPQPAAATTTTCSRPTSSPRPRRWRSARPRRRCRAEGTAGGGRAPPGHGGQPPDQRDPRRGAHPVPCSARSSRSTSTACSPRARSGASTRSTSGAWSWARCWPSAIIPELTAADEPDLGHDSSTNALIRRYRALKQALRRHQT